MGEGGNREKSKDCAFLCVSVDVCILFFLFFFLLGLRVDILYEWGVFTVSIYGLNEYINSAVFFLYSETPVFSTSFTIKTVCVHIQKPGVSG